jgi:hypothetical protein
LWSRPRRASQRAFGAYAKFYYRAWTNGAAAEYHRALAARVYDGGGSAVWEGAGVEDEDPGALLNVGCFFVNTRRFPARRCFPAHCIAE